MQNIIYEEPTVWLFLLVTVVLGGWTAWMTGRAVALAWGSAWQALIWCVPLAVAVRFIHFALFQGTFMSPHFYVVDLVVLAIFASVSHRLTRARQMTRQYRWLYDRAGPFGWREKAQA